MGSYVFRWPYQANNVYVSGTFDDWGKTVQLDKVGDHWEKEVDLPSADERVLYKFVVDDQWVVDGNAPKTDEGHWNANNLLLPEQIKRKPVTTSKTDDIPGAFPQDSTDDDTLVGVNPIPASSGISNPIDLAPGAKVPEDKGLTAATTESAVTTSKEDYEKPQPSPFPEHAAEEAENPSNAANEFSVAPIPASSGIGNPINLAPGATIPEDKGLTASSVESAVTTSKDDYEKAQPSPFPEPPSKEATEFSVAPIPASSGIENPIELAPGATVPHDKGITAPTVDSSVTTSKEDYEQTQPSPFPETSTKEADEFSVKPVPATSGASNPVSVPAGSEVPSHKDVTSNTVDSTVTTSKEDYENASSSAKFPGSEDVESEFSVKPVPASSGVSNPISLPAGTAIPDQKEITQHTLDSNVTTSKEDYEKPASSFPAFAAAGAGAGVLGAAAVASAFSIEPAKKNLIPESSLPMGGEKKDAIGDGPFIRSSGPGTTTAELASKVPLETNPIISSSATSSTTADLAAQVPLKKSSFSLPSVPDASTSKLASELEIPLKRAPFTTSSATSSTIADLAAKVPLENDPTIRSSATGTTTSALAANVPLETAGVPSIVKESIASANQQPEAASSVKTVQEKAELEKELLSKTPVSPAAGESASSTSATQSAVAAGVPAVVKESISSANQQPEAASSVEAVQEKAELEKELLSKTPVSSAAGESASSTSATQSAVAAGVPAVVKESISSANQEPEATSSAEAVQEKAELEKELLSKTPVSSAAGESASSTSATQSAVAAGVPAVVKESISSANQEPEATNSAEAVEDKAALEKELLSKTPVSQAAGESASAATHQTSYYGIATSVPSTVEASLEKAHASPEAAAESSAVAEKFKVEQELLSKIPSTSEAGEPAPTIAASTSATAPTSTSAEATATSLTDGKTANTVVPDTDTSSAAHGHSAGELAGGAGVGGAVAAGVAALVSRHKDADVEPPRIADSQKPDITTERSPATAIKDVTSSGESSLKRPTPTTLDSSVDPALANEPAVKLMTQNEGLGSSTLPVAHDATSSATPATSVDSPPPSAATPKEIASSEVKKDFLSSIHDTTTLPASAAPVAATAAPVSTVLATSHSTAHDATTSPVSTSVIEPSSSQPTADVTSKAVASTPSATPAAAVTGTETSASGTTDVPSSTPAPTPATGVKSSTSTGTAVPKASGQEVSPSTAAIGGSESAGPSTPVKKPRPVSGVDSPASANTSTTSKERKKRHRISAFIKKIFD